MTARATAGTDETPRLFIAVLVPSDAADAIERSIDPWRPRVREARWVPRANWHVTVRFLGPTPRDVVPWICERLRGAAAACPRFQTKVSGLGTFPASRRGVRVLWAGLDDPTQGFRTVSSEVARTVKERFPDEPRGDTPHITLARGARSIRLPSGLLDTRVLSPRFAVEEIRLMRSRLDRTGARYETEGSFGLADGR